MQIYDRELKQGQVRLANMNLVLIGVVTDNCHEESLGEKNAYRVKVKFPTLPKPKGGEEDSFWCRIMTLGASKDGMGMFFLPETDDEVLVVFLNGDFNQGFILGTLWNGKDKPSFSNSQGKSETKRFHDNDEKFVAKPDAKKNDIRSISTRAGHELIFNDNKNKPLITLTSGQKHRIVLNDKNNEPTQIEIFDGKEENYVLIDTKNKKITIESKTGDILIKAKETIRLEAKKIETDSKKNTEMKVGQNWDVQVDKNMTQKAGQQATIQSGQTMTIKGQTVNIN